MNIRLRTAGLLVLGAAAATAGSAAVTFHKDVLPILQKNCQSCHRPGPVAPMSFLSTQIVRGRQSGGA